jgi:hypothetical protein
MKMKQRHSPWPWLGLIVALAGAYVWWLSLAALRIGSAGQ